MSDRHFGIGLRLDSDRAFQRADFEMIMFNADGGSLGDVRQRYPLCEAEYVYDHGPDRSDAHYREYAGRDQEPGLTVTDGKDRGAGGYGCAGVFL